MRMSGFGFTLIKIAYNSMKKSMPLTKLLMIIENNLIKMLHVIT